MADHHLLLDCFHLSLLFTTSQANPKPFLTMQDASYLFAIAVVWNHGNMANFMRQRARTIRSSILPRANSKWTVRTLHPNLHNTRPFAMLTYQCSSSRLPLSLTQTSRLPSVPYIPLVVGCSHPSLLATTSQCLNPFQSTECRPSYC